jgi:hypothetical protein
LPFGTLIINKLIAESIHFDKYIGTSHAYSAIPWETIISKIPPPLTLFYADKQLITLGSIRKTWSTDAIDIYLYQIPLWFNLLPDVYVNKYRILQEYLHQHFKIRRLIYLKKSNSLKGLSSDEYLSPYQKLLYNMFKRI